MNNRQVKFFFVILLSSALILPLFFVSASQSEIQISVSAAVRGTSTPATSTPPGPEPEPGPTSPGPWGGGGGGSYIPPETSIIFKGKAYPSAYLNISKNEVAVATFRADSSGLFEREISGLAGDQFAAPETGLRVRGAWALQRATRGCGRRDFV